MPKTYEELLGFKKMQDISLERLSPPRAPIASETEVGDRYNQANDGVSVIGLATSSKLAIDFSYLTNNSSFQRAIIEFIRKYIPGFENVNPRASKDIMTKSFNKNIANYKEVMKELKLKLEGRKDE